VPEAYSAVSASLASLTVVIVAVLWAGNHGLSDLFTGGATALVSVGRLTGLISADLLLLQVLLLARVPFVERAFGQDRLAIWHRYVGLTSFNLMLIHIVLTTLGYANADPGKLVSQFLKLVLKYPGMMLALLATLAIIMVAVTSFRSARRKLRYEAWHLLHLYAYLGVGLAIPHEVWTGADFIASPVSRLYWWSLYAAALLAILGWRVGLPVYRSLRHRIVVHRVVREAPGVVSIYLRGRDLDRIGVRAGQFFTWRFRDGAGWTRGHPYSLSAAPTRDTLRITVKNLGDGSARLAGLRPGTKVLVEGPYGRLHGGVRTRRRITLLASGIGITPLRALLEELPYAPGEATLIYRARETRDVTFKREIDALAQRRGARVFYVLGRRIRNRDSWLPENAAHLPDAAALLELVPDVAEHDVYICGADAWMDAAAAAALAADVPAENVHMERFTW
jgi:predicted ferric reductase